MTTSDKARFAIAPNGFVTVLRYETVKKKPLSEEEIEQKRKEWLGGMSIEEYTALSLAVEKKATLAIGPGGVITPIVDFSSNSYFEGSSDFRDYFKKRSRSSNYQREDANDPFNFGRSDDEQDHFDPFDFKKNKRPNEEGPFTNPSHRHMTRDDLEVILEKYKDIRDSRIKVAEELYKEKKPRTYESEVNSANIRYECDVKNAWQDFKNNQRGF